MSTADQLEKMMVMLEKGLITREEFDQVKRKLLSEATASPEPTSADPLSGPTRMASPAGSGLSGTTRVVPPNAFPPQVGSYRVFETIGEGGMGKVVRARHIEESWAKRQGGDVAIKLVHPHLAADPEFRERFLDEAELGQRLQHSSIARVHGVIVEGTRLGAVMDFIEGEPLSSLVKPGGLPLERVVVLLKPIALALDHLHAQGIIHRDLKPDNIKIRPDGRPVILDLGIAKDTASDSGRTRTSIAMGTSAWMAPEQADAKNVSPAADRYALGIITYVLLSGRLPWRDGISDTRIGMVKLMDQLLPLTDAQPNIDVIVAQCVTRMLALRAEDRFETSSGFVEALERAPHAAATIAEQRVEEHGARREAEEPKRKRQEKEARQRVQSRSASKVAMAAALPSTIGTPGCEVCGRRARKGARFCSTKCQRKSYAGSAKPTGGPEAAPQLQACEVCGRRVRKSARFCSTACQSKSYAGSAKSTEDSRPDGAVLGETVLVQTVGALFGLGGLFRKR